MSVQEHEPFSMINSSSVMAIFPACYPLPNLNPQSSIQFMTLVRQIPSNNLNSPFGGSSFYRRQHPFSLLRASSCSPTRLPRQIIPSEP